MKQYPPEKIRNVGIIGSGATGKTTLSEALLFKSGTANRQGNISDGNTVSDYDPEEIRRGISIHSTLLPFEWKEHKINLIDTPGYIDFIGESISTLRVVDSLLIVVDAVSGHGAALENLWKIADRYKIPKALVVNKLDKSQADFDKIVENLRKKFGREIIPVQVPLGSEADFSKVHSLLKPEAPAELKETITIFKEMLIEGMAEIDDTILTEYLENKEITEQELTETLKKAINADKIFPVFCVSSTKNIGIEELLNAIIEWMPPANEKEIPAKTSDGKEVSIKPDAKELFSAYTFKTVAEPHIGNLTYIRVYSGTIKPSSSVLNASKGKEERIGQIITMRGKTREDLPVLSAGDIAVLPKLKITGTGDTLCDKNKAVTFEPAEYPEPVMSFAVKPKSKADQEKMALGLGSFTHEDPTFKMNYNAETKETVISGMGDVHLEVILKRLKERHGIEIEIGEPRIPYKETIVGKAKSQGKYKKQTGGRGQYGDTWLEIEPLPRGQGFEFANKIVGGAIPRNYIPSVEKGIREAMVGGVIAGYPVVDVKVTLFDGSYHEVDSSDLAFKIAASMGFKKAIQDAKPILLEPIVEITVNVPPEFVGEVTGDLNKRRGRISNIEADKVVALVPLGEIAKYATDLRSFTHGQGTFSTKFSHYEQVPPQTQQKLVGTYQKLKEAGGVER
ncbi:elongation factor G [candidate division WOR-1 bacterium DG_54_3]|uniref:Elongation factor G n=1 Tax=candidate division WOR-1 bacterium DG_54_3 TaxID=1703775 RepID=A0A0S7Y536_UNCSA|nr:MAG: elongation factor G [candidate division WOR-1 bacterium DG_54_3]